jgi:hypothetical protein
MPALVRMNRGTPKRRSSLANACVTAGCELWMAFAAAVVLPSKATSRNASKILTLGNAAASAEAVFVDIR